MLVAVDSEGRSRPGPLTCPEREHLLSCLHAIGAAFALGSIDDAALNRLIRAIETRDRILQAPIAKSLSADLDRLVDRVFVEQVRELHGTLAIEVYRRTRERVRRGLMESIQGREDLPLEYLEPA
jgi:hypothetical protein